MRVVLALRGNALLPRGERPDASLSHPYPLGDLVAETQGVIGYWLQQALGNAGLRMPVVALVTQTVIAAHDPAFGSPSEFVGSVYSEARARALTAKHGWRVAQDGDSWRRVVASPLGISEMESDWFSAGSMGRKVQAACQFVRATGRPGAIRSLDGAFDVVSGRAGTQVSTQVSP